MIESRRRFEVFIGSTRKDFEQFRDLLIRSVLAAGHIPTGMELWPSAGLPVGDVVGSRLDTADVHLILIGARYGQLKPDLGMSYTEWEYKRSKAPGSQRPVIGFLLEDDAFEEEHEKVCQSDPSEKETSQKLKDFRKAILDNDHVSRYRPDAEALQRLSADCMAALWDLERRGLRVEAGWIRASDRDVIQVREIRDNPFLAGSIDRLARFSTLTRRVLQGREAKEAAARTFWKHMVYRIRNARSIKNLFFESGSTLAYVSSAFEREVLTRGGHYGAWNLSTNNVLTLLQLMVQTGERVDRLPSAPPDPDDPYGAMFPPQWRGISRPHPMEPHDLSEEEVKEVRQLRALLPKDALVLATTSGLDLTHDVLLFRGPHVGSHPNMLFKRALMTSGLPVVVFLHADKLGDPFVVKKCFPVFDGRVSWDEARKRYPMAFCVGWGPPDTEVTDSAGRNQRVHIYETLRGLGFTHVYADQTINAKGNLTGALVMGNEKFNRRLPVEEESFSQPLDESETGLIALAN